MQNSLLKQALRAIGLDVKRAEHRVNNYIIQPAWNYQSTYILPHYKKGDRVIDIGCGGAPSPISTVLTDFFPDESIHRARPVVEDRPLIICSALNMPLRDGCFDLSICSHVLEHVPNPSQAAHEIGRISRKGYLETPAYGKDILIGTGHQHIWQVVSSQGTLHFFPYTERQHNAHADSPFMNIWCQQEYHPWQEFFWERQDIFNAIQFWEDAPNVEVHHEIPDTSGSSECNWQPVPTHRISNAPASLTDTEIALLENCLTTPDKSGKMTYSDGNFVDTTGRIFYPVRAKRIYFEIGSL